MNEPPSSLESFEREFAGCGDWRGAFGVALEGLVNNTFTQSLREMDETNLPTLELRNPQAHATIKDRRTREALVISGLFQVARQRSPGAVEDLEICWDTGPYTGRLLHAVVELTAGRNSAISPPGGWPGQAYAGVEGVKVFLRALDVLIDEVGRSDWERFDVLHEIAHGGKRRHGTPLDEIRICYGAVDLSLVEVLRMISGYKNP